jgi:hypothetical protein
MNLKELRLELHDLADELDAVVYDNGPMGESAPFRDKARRLRELARGVKGMGNTGRADTGTGDFRDEPWEPR